ncbi:MAG: hypothetical protein IJM10_01935 [Clostridia bacterium]|nr:hypothetical protein [Clostridia bacterium]
MGSFLRRKKAEKENPPPSRDGQNAVSSEETPAENTPGKNELPAKTVERLLSRKDGDPFATYYGCPNSKRAAKLQLGKKHCNGKRRTER